MRIITLSPLMLGLALGGFAQTPAGPVGPAAQTPSAAPAEKASPAPAAPAAPAEPPAAGDDSRIIVPAETTIPIMLMTPINTKSAFVGASFYCESVYPITVGNRIIIPRGSSVKGTITQVVGRDMSKAAPKLACALMSWSCPTALPSSCARSSRASEARAEKSSSPMREGSRGIAPKEKTLGR